MHFVKANYSIKQILQFICFIISDLVYLHFFKSKEHNNLRVTTISDALTTKPTGQGIYFRIFDLVYFLFLK